MGAHFIIIKPIFFRGFVVFRFELRCLSKKSRSTLVEKLGFFNSDSSFRYLSLNTYRLGLWLNKGAFVKKPFKFVKYIITFLSAVL